MEKKVRISKGKVYLRETDVTRVEPMGSKNANIAIIGEAPGREEERKGKLFVGKSGRLLDQLLGSVGINRYDCYITNVLKVRPPKNNIKYYYDGKAPSDDLKIARSELRDELREVQPNVIIALGQEALRTVLQDDTLKISNWRGSVIDTEFGKVVPTYHPAYVLRMWKYKSILHFDLHRAFNESHSRELERPERTLLTDPSLREVKEFVKECKESEYLSFDIETRKTSKWFIDHVGIALAPDYAMSIPFWKDGKHYWSVEDEIEVWKLLAEVLGDKSIKKIAQNAPYDTIFLEEYNIPIYNLWMDTMVAVKLVYPEFSKSLQFITSIYTKEPYYKDTNDTERSIYNAKDCAVTYEGAFGILEDLEELEMKDFYFDHVHPLIPIYIEIQQFGVRIDHNKIEKVQEQVEKEIEDLRDKLKELTGKEINVYSVKDMRNYIYGDLDLKKKYNDNGNLDTCKKVLNDFYRNTGREEFKVMINLRKARSQSSTYLSAETDEDGRMRTSYDVSGTETGRLSSKKDVHGRGMNLQNVQHGVYREMFIPDEGMKFYGADLSQAENRVVAYLSEDENMISVVESEGDIHKQNAAMIFEKAPEDITHDERQLGKRITHGCLLPDTEVLTPEGWVEFQELEEGTKTAQYNQETREINFVEPEILKYDYEGKMYRAKSNGQDTVYSPTHRVPRIAQRKFQAGRMEMSHKTAEEFANGSDGVKQGMMPTSGYFKPEQTVDIDKNLARLLVAVQADGSITDYGAVRFTLKRDRKKKRLKELLDKANIKWHFGKTEKEHHERFYILVEDAKPIVEWLDKDKQFGNWIYNLETVVLEALVQETKYWDGSARDTKQLYSWFYFTTSKNNAEKIQTASHLTGYTASLCEIENNKYEGSFGDRGSSQTLYRVNIMDKRFIGLRGEHWNSQDYEGDIYCLSVPNEAFLIRSNGKIHVTLNSNYKMGAITFARYAKVSTRRARKLLKKYMQTYPKIDIWHKEVEKQVRKHRELKNSFGRKKVFHDRMDHKLFRNATAWVPQSCVADTLHRATRNIYARLPHPARIVLQLHDAITIQSSVDVSKIIKQELERPFEIDDKTISIPTEILVGNNWEEVS